MVFSPESLHTHARAHSHTHTYTHTRRQTHTVLTKFPAAAECRYDSSPAASLLCQLLRLCMGLVGVIDRRSIITHTQQHVRQRSTKVTEPAENPECFLFLSTSTLFSRCVRRSVLIKCSAASREPQRRNAFGNLGSSIDRLMIKRSFGYNSVQLFSPNNRAVALENSLSVDFSLERSLSGSCGCSDLVLFTRIMSDSPDVGARFRRHSPPTTAICSCPVPMWNSS